MVKREEVETLLREMRDALCRQHQGTWAPSAAFVQDHMERIEELARTWLAVDEAPVGVVDSFVGGRWWVDKCDMAHFTTLKGQCVKLVLAPEAGGGEG